MSEKKKLTTNVGCPVVDNQNVITTRPLAQFGCEVIPERCMSAKWSGA